MWQWVKYALFGIAWGCTWLVVMGVVLSLSDAAAFQALMADYPRQALGAAVVGVASTLPARVYAVRRLPYLWRFAIHIVVALSVFFPVSFALGWIPYYPQAFGITLVEILLGIGIFFAIWLVFFLFNRQEARRINQRVRDLEKGRDRDDADPLAR